MKQFGAKKYPSQVRDMFSTYRKMWDALKRHLRDAKIDESFRFLEAYYSGKSRKHIHDKFIASQRNPINIRGTTRQEIVLAYTTRPFDQNKWDTALIKARNEIENMVESQPLFDEFWMSKDFWALHLSNGGRPDDIRLLARRDLFIAEYTRLGLTEEVRATGEDLIRREGIKLNLAELIQRLEQDGLIARDAMYDAAAASKLFGSDNPIPIQRFMDDYKKKPEWREVLSLAQKALQALFYLGTPEEFIDELIKGGFIPDNRLAAQAENTDGGDDDDNRSEGGDGNLGNGGGGNDNDEGRNGGPGNGGGGNAGDGGDNGGSGGPPGGGNDGDDDSVDMNEWLSLDGDDNSEEGDEERHGGGEPLSLSDFVLRLPDSADELIQDHMAQIAEAMMPPADNGLAEARISTLAFFLTQESAPENAGVDFRELEDYIRQIARNMMPQQGAPGPGNPPGPDGDDSDNGDGDDRRFTLNSAAFRVSLDIFRDTGRHMSGNDGRSEGGRLTLDEFVLRLPDSAEELIQEHMAQIAETMSRGDDSLADRLVDALAFSLVEESAPENAARVNLKELQDYIRQIARTMTRQQGGPGPGNPPGPDDDDSDNGDGDDRRSTFNSAASRVSLDIFRDTGRHLSGDDGSDSQRSRSTSEDLDELLADPVDAEGGTRRQATNAGGNQAENGAGVNVAPPGAEQSELMSLIRNARHTAGSSEIDRLLAEVRTELVPGNILQAQQSARALASLLLGGPREEPHLQTLFEAEVKKITRTILMVISKALKERKGKAGNGADGNPGNGPRDRGPGPGPGGGSAGANGNTRGNGNGNANGGGATTAPQADEVYNRDTMDRMERERNASAPKGDLAALVATEIRAITKMLAEKKIEEAKQRAVALSKQLVGNGGVVPEMPAETILKLAHGKVAALRASNPEVTPAPMSTPTNGATPTAGGAGDADDDDPAITLDPATAERLVPVTDWKVFCGVYQIEVKEIKNLKALALKAVWEPKDAHAGCKLLMSRREDKGKGKSQVKIKNEKYLAHALVHAVKMKAVKKTLKKPMKATGAADL
ncbi:hypothetical protein [Rhizobium sp. GN54]|uniref:hypothetical protein n=1 Tax=Rhizobium sp. GN54 TaxID=2898150 RepID=UPI001E51F285|nr:hypothetical protein [Rhizobium sp. GN54]MCD2184621.1 hypothetical protein [Rhizobium sp. GN54]